MGGDRVWLFVSFHVQNADGRNWIGHGDHRSDVRGDGNREVLCVTVIRAKVYDDER